MITQYVLKTSQITAAQWGYDGDVIDISNWLTQKHGPHLPGLIADAASETPTISGPGWEIDTANNRIFIKAVEGQFWVNPTDWIVMSFYADGSTQVLPLNDADFQYTYVQT